MDLDDWSRPPYQDVHPQEGRARRAAVTVLMVCNWGQIGACTRKSSRAPCGRSVDEFRTRGQVGQESHLQPAVLEPRVREFMGVHALSLYVATRLRSGGELAVRCRGLSDLKPCLSPGILHKKSDWGYGVGNCQ
jgi:hypothetical protein